MNKSISIIYNVQSIFLQVMDYVTTLILLVFPIQFRKILFYTKDEFYDNFINIT